MQEHGTNLIILQEDMRSIYRKVSIYIYIIIYIHTHRIGIIQNVHTEGGTSKSQTYTIPYNPYQKISEASKLSSHGSGCHFSFELYLW